MKETDLRVIKTKKALSSSLLQFFEQQLFQTILSMEFATMHSCTANTIINIFMMNIDLLEYLFNQLTKDYFARDIMTV